MGRPRTDGWRHCLRVRESRGPVWLGSIDHACRAAAAIRQRRRRLATEQGDLWSAPRGHTRIRRKKMTHTKTANRILVDIPADETRPFILIDGSTIHLVLPSVEELGHVVQSFIGSPATRAFLRLELDFDFRCPACLRWYVETTDIDGHRHVLDFAVNDDALYFDAEHDDEVYGYSESSSGRGRAHELADLELERFGLPGGVLYLDGTRSLRVSQRLTETTGTLTWAALLYEQANINSYTWTM